MSFDTKLFSAKLTSVLGQFATSIEKVSLETSIPVHRLKVLLEGKTEPSGDEVLILADYFKCDYRFFISNERLTAYEQTEKLFRAHADELDGSDRWLIQEFLFLCDAEQQLQDALHKSRPNTPALTSKTRSWRQQGALAAAKIRRHLGIMPKSIHTDIFKDIRSLGIHIFRRPLKNAKISGVFIRHPIAGPCILINGSEDFYRQRFSAAHEAAHAILDHGEEASISFKWSNHDRSEIRANAFASAFLLPSEILRILPDPNAWTNEDAIKWCHKLKVNAQTLAIALERAKRLKTSSSQRISKIKVPRIDKDDPELNNEFSVRGHDQLKLLVARGLSRYFVQLAIDAYQNEFVSFARLCEILLSSEAETREIMELYGVRSSHAS